MDNLITAGILLVLMGALCWKLEYCPGGNDGFFDTQNTKALRGFWCVIVILVHIPYPYQNAVQDLAGSFAYVGVTFFFMTSAYGLTLGQRKNPRLSGFWRRRLPKLLITNLARNVFFWTLFLVLFGWRATIWQLLDVDCWVTWLLGCFLFFWIGHRFCGKWADWSIAACLIVISLAVYWINQLKIMQTSNWSSEAYGFLWGIALARYDTSVRAFLQRKWLAGTVFWCICSLVLGAAYLKLKPVVFFGNYLLRILLGAAILMFLLALNARIRIGNRIIWALGEISFEVYLFHSFVFQLVQNLAPQLSSGAFILTSMALTFLSAALVHRFCRWAVRKVQEIPGFLAA